MAVPAQVSGWGASQPAGSTNARFNWTAASGATGYEISASKTSGNQSNIISTVGNVLTDGGTAASYGITTGTWYFYIRGTNSSGKGPWSLSRSVTFDLASPGAVGSVSATQASSTSQNVNVTWGSPPTPSDVDVYHILRGTSAGSGSEIATATASDRSYIDDVPADGTYYYGVYTEDSWGNISTKTWSSGVKVSTPPTSPSPFTASVTGRVVTLTWNIGTNTASYAISRNGTALKTVSYPNNTTTDTVSADGTYSYSIVAKNTAGDQTLSASTSATVVSAPSAPVMYTPSVSGSTVTLSWYSTGGSPTGYKLYRGISAGSTTTLVKSIPGTSTTDVPGDGTWYYTVTATNAGGESSKSAAVNVSIDTTPPSVPTWVSGTSSGGISTLTWNASTGAPIGYVLYRDGQQVKSINGTSTTDTPGAPPGSTTYNYTLKSYDTNGNYSALSAAKAVVHNMPPSTPAAPTATLATSPSRTITVTWGAVNTATTYNLFVNGVKTQTGLTTYQQIINNVADGTYTYSISATSPYGESPESLRTQVYVDRTAPQTAPSGMTANQVSKSSRQVQLSWNVTTDTTMYNMYRNGTFLYNTTSTSGTDVPLADGSYQYYVTGQDAYGNVGSASNIATAVVSMTPNTPGAPTLTMDPTPSRNLSATWGSVAGATGYVVYLDGVQAGTATGTLISLANTTDGPHTVTIAATNTYGNSPQGPGTSIIVDRTPPTVPANVTAVQPTRANRGVTVSWTANADVAQFKVWKAGSVIATVATNSYSYTETADAPYTYTVTALDAAGNTSVASSSATVTVDTKPSKPATPTVTLAAVPSRTATVTWTTVQYATSYILYMDGSQVASGLAVLTYDVPNVTDGDHTFQVTAVNASGASPRSDAATLTTVDRTPPPQPVITATASGNHVVITWAASVDASLYEVSRGGTVVGTTAFGTYTDTPGADGTYSYTVRGRDTAGNWSVTSTAASATVDTTPPAVPTITVGNVGQAVTVRWNAPTDAVNYDVYRNSTYVATTASTLYTQTVGDGTYSYQVRAADNRNNYSALSTAVSITVDTTPPRVPSLTGRVSDTTATLNWDSNTDAVLFEVLRGGSSQSTLTGTTFSQDLPDGTYSYTVRAQDAAGNWSAESTAVSLTVNNIAGIPGPPTLQRAFPFTSDTRAQISWPLVAGATQYRILVDNAQFAEFAAGVNPPQLIAPPEGNHNYQIRALLPSGNWSVPGAATSFLQQTTPPATPGKPTLQITDLDNKQVLVTWTGILGSLPVVLFRNNVQLAVLDAGTTQYQDTVPDYAGYDYALAARDAWGNQSATGAYNSIYLAKPIIIDKVVNLTYSLGNARVVTLNWTWADNSVDFDIERNGVVITNVNASTYVDNSLTTDATYIYRVRGIGPGGQIGPWSDPVSVAVTDTTPPPTPEDTLDKPTLTVTLSGRTSTAIWAPITGATQYELFRNGSSVGTTNINTMDDSLTVDGPYTYTVRAGKAGPIWSDISDPVTIMLNTVAPAAPNLTLKSNDRAVTVLWGSVPNAVSYTVYRDDVQVYQGTAKSFAETLAYGTYVYDMTATDADGNTSEYSEPKMIVLETPVQPPILAGTKKRNAVTLTWNAVADAVAYFIYNGTTLVKVTADSTYTDENLVEASYSYRVRGRDEVGAFGGYSNTVDITIGDITPPAPPIITSAVADQYNAVITWTFDAITGDLSVQSAERRLTADDDTDATVIYEINRDGIVIGNTTDMTYTDENLDIGTYNYSLRAEDADGNTSAYTDSAPVEIKDVTAPDAPHRPHLTVTGHSVRLDWDSVYTAVKYYVYRDGSRIGTTTDLNLTDTVVDGTYSYTLTAEDDAGNVSIPSKEAVLTIAGEYVKIPTQGKLNLGRPALPELSLGRDKDKVVRPMLDR